MNKKYTYLVIFFLIVASVIAFGRILGNDFINFDDNIYITENSNIKSGINTESIKWAFTAVVSSNWHPLTLLSHVMDWSLFKEYAGGHHFISLLLHIGSVLLLFLFLNKTTKSIWPAAFVAALFAIHPLRVESVAWAAERKDVLSVFFGLATLYAYAYYAEKPQLSKYFLCLILFALGLMSKPMLVTLPFVLLLLDYWPLGRWQKALKPEIAPFINNKVLTKKKNRQRQASAKREKVISSNQSSSQMISHLLWEKGPFLFLTVLSSILTIWAQHKAIASLQKLPFTERVTNAIVSYVAYLGKFFWPVDLAVFYPYSHSLPIWQISGAAAILIVIGITVICFIKKAPFLFVGWFIYLGTLVPVIGLMQVGNQAMADRYTYFPSIGIGIMLAWGTQYLLPQAKLRKIFLVPLAIIMLTILSILTWQQCGYWKNSTILFNHALQVTKENYMAHTNLGVALAAERKNEEAIEHYRAALRINYNDDTVHYNLGNVLSRLGRTEEALNHYREAVRINPNYSNAHNNLGLILTIQNKNDEAIYHYRQALRINPGDPGFYLNLGVALARKGEWQEAIDQFRTAIVINPAYEETRRALQWALESGKIHGAK